MRSCISPIAAHRAATLTRTMFDATPSLLPFITAGKLRALAAASPQRHHLLPDVPSFAELGYPGMDIALWYGVAVPAVRQRQSCSGSMPSSSKS